MQPNNNNPGEHLPGLFCCIDAANRYDSLVSQSQRTINNNHIKSICLKKSRSNRHQNPRRATGSKITVPLFPHRS